MRNYDGLYDFRPSLIGSIGAGASITAIGAPVDTIGFKDVLAMLIVGGVHGSGTGATATLSVKIQESARILGSSTEWTDITNGGYHAGSFDFNDVTISGTEPAIQKAVQYEVLGDGNRKRYIRAFATIVGTAGINPKVAVSFLLGRPNDTLYIANATTQATGNIEYTWNK